MRKKRGWGDGLAGGAKGQGQTAVANDQGQFVGARTNRGRRCVCHKSDGVRAWRVSSLDDIITLSAIEDRRS